MDRTITLKELRPELPKVVDSIDSKMDRFIVTRRGKPVVVMMNIDDYEALLETLDILGDRQAMDGLKCGVADMRQGKTRSWKEIRQSLEKV